MTDQKIERVTLIGPIPPPNGGMAMQLMQLERLLADSGIAITKIAVNPPFKFAWIGRIKGLRALVRLWEYRRALRQQLTDQQVAHVMANSGLSWFLYAVPAIRICKQKQIPVLLNYRGGLAAEFFAKSWAKIAPDLEKVARIVVPSSFLEGVFAEHGAATQILPNILDRSQFHIRDLPKSLVAPHIIVTRNLEALYDNATALRAFAIVKERIPEARLSIAGSGAELDNLKALASELDIAKSVTFCGRLGRAQMVELYQSADLMMNPSLADNMPNSLLEALASGVPIVSTNVGGIPSMVVDGVTARLVEPGDHQAMAQALLELLSSESLYRQYYQNGLDHIESFTWPRVKPILLGHYQDLSRS